MPPKKQKILEHVETGVAANDDFVMSDFTPPVKKASKVAAKSNQGLVEATPDVLVGQAWSKVKHLIPPTSQHSGSAVAASSSSSDSIKLGPFELDNYYLTNCMDALKLIPDASVDHIITSPPYNLAGLSRSHGRGLSSSTRCETGWTHRIPYAEGFKDCVPEQQYQDAQIEILNHFARIVKPTTGSIFYSHKNRHCVFRDFSPLDWIQKSKCNVFQELIWDRATSVNAHPSYFIQNTEKIYWLTPTRTGPRFFRDRLPNEFKTHLWKINVRKESKHPAQMPLQIAYNTILSTTEPGDIVLDPFAGGGTTLLAAAKLGRRFIGFDVCEEYETMFWQRMMSMVQNGEIMQDTLQRVLPRLQARQQQQKRQQAMPSSAAESE